MSWFVGAKPKPKTSAPAPHRRHGHHFSHHVDAVTERRLAEFLIAHGRLEARPGRPMLQLLGTCRHHDGSQDFSIRTRVTMQDGGVKTFDSHVRLQPTDHLRLIR